MDLLLFPLFQLCALSLSVCLTRLAIGHWRAARGASCAKLAINFPLLIQRPSAQLRAAQQSKAQDSIAQQAECERALTCKWPAQAHCALCTVHWRLATLCTVVSTASWWSCKQEHLIFLMFMQPYTNATKSTKSASCSFAPSPPRECLPSGPPTGPFPLADDDGRVAVLRPIGFRLSFPDSPLLFEEWKLFTQTFTFDVSLSLSLCVA